MTDSAARPPDYPDKCELCGTPVRVVGSVTQNYESAYGALLAERNELKRDLERTDDMYAERGYELLAWQEQAEALAGALDAIACNRASNGYAKYAKKALSAYRAFRKGEGGTRE